MISLWAASAISLMALAVFSACEAALTSVSRIRLRHWAGKRLLGSDAGELLERPRVRLATPPPDDGGMGTSRKVATWMAGERGLPKVAPQRGWEALKAVGFSIQAPRPKNPASATPEEREAFKKARPGRPSPRKPRSTPPTPVEVFATDEIVSHCQKRWTRQRHTATCYKRKTQHHPTIHDVGGNQCGEAESGESCNHLRVHHQTASIDQVGKHATRECEDKTGRGGHEGVESEPERRIGQMEDEPTLCNRLHPRPDI